MRAYSHAAAHSLHSSFDDVRDTEGLSDLTQVSLDPSFVLHDRRAADDLQVGDLGQIGEDFVLDAVREITVLLVITEILKRQNGNAFRRNRSSGTNLRSSSIDGSTPQNNKEAERQSANRQKQSDYEQRFRPTRRINRMNRNGLLPPFAALEFFRHFTVPEAVLIEINQAQPQSMFHFALAQIVQVRLPMAVLRKIVRQMFR